jgi:hypothetical protein
VRLNVETGGFAKFQAQGATVKMTGLRSGAPGKSETGASFGENASFFK